MFINELFDYVALLAYLVKARNSSGSLKEYGDLHDRIFNCEQKILQIVSAQMDLDDMETINKLINEVEI